MGTHIRKHHNSSRRTTDLAAYRRSCRKLKDRKKLSLQRTNSKALEKLRKISTHTKPNDFILLNQSRGTQKSERLWKDAISEALVESRLADWSEDDSNDCRKIDVHSGKNIT